MAYIIFKANKFQLDNEDFTIGRNDNNILQIKENTVSRNHAVIRPIGGKYYVIDVGSSNGTYKDGKKIQGSPILLEDKSIVQCGNAQLVFRNDEEDEDDETLLAFSSNFIVNSIVLVADIRGYTSFSEHTSIQIVSKIMAKWLKEVDYIITQHNGHIDSFIGDCVYARWDEKTDRDTLIDVLKVAKYISDKTKEISSDLTNNQHILDIGVGINIGEVIVGAETKNTGLGDTINTAFRLEGQTRVLDTDIIISKSAYELLDTNLTLIDTKLKGKKGDIQVCSIKFDEVENIN
jgi:adenylate cyclase